MAAVDRERDSQWLSDHLDNIRAILRSVGKELVEISDIQTRESETESEEYYDA